MPILRLAYVTQFLIALIAVFTLWSEVGGQGHLDLMPWYAKAALGAGAAFATVKATAAAVSDKQAWNRRTRRWCGVLLAVLVACGLATYYCHVYLETDEDGQDGGDNSALLRSLYEDRVVSSPALGSVWREGEACLAPTRRVVGAGYIRPEASRNNRTVPRLVGAADPAGNQRGGGDRLRRGEVVLLA
jgi:hypothetical protein